jgi:hypothetical protein
MNHQSEQVLELAQGIAANEKFTLVERADTVYGILLCAMTIINIDTETLEQLWRDLTQQVLEEMKQ